MNRSFKVSFVLIVLLAVLCFSSCTINFRDVGIETGTGTETTAGGKLALGIDAINGCLKDHAYYYDNYDEEQMSVAAIKAYVNALGDDYAEYYTEEEYRRILADRNGELEGIGVTVVATTVEVSGQSYRAYHVVNVYKDSPAFEYGLLPGDLIYAVMVDGSMLTINELGYDRTINSMRGEAGTTVTIAAFRQVDGEYNSLTFRDIVRKKIKTYSVTASISTTDPTVGIIKISSFDNPTADQFIEAIEGLKAQGIEKFVFDLRNNLGGYVSSVCRILSFFLQQNDLMLSAVDKNGKTVSSYRVDPKTMTSINADEIGKYRGINATVLVNENTASAAEIFTANMIYYNVAKVIGVKTFGKGIMQNTYSLSNYGFSGYLKLTIYAYTDPSGYCYHEVGINPDILEELPEEARKINLYLLPEADDTQLQRAIRELQ